ncbi:MAG: aspartate aminotransferase family protein [Candidatus Hydrogenedentota bacterium]|nr:MAG: aspartate aminotransferase family protein [Candidatus Hydrogenedentota bacterium]
MDKDMYIEQADYINKSKQEKPAKQEISYTPGSFLSFEEIEKLDKKYVLNTYNRMPVAFRYGSGEFLYDTEGKEYIDFLSGIAVTALGHANADLIEALNRQADLLWHTSNLFYNEQQALLARALIEVTFPGKVFFCNSGTEANEAAFKAMRAYGVSQNPAKVKIIALDKSFHGRSTASMSMTGQEKIHSGFGPLLDNIEYVPANDIDSLVAAFDETVCGIIMEPIQGEGGVVPLQADFLEAARELAEDYKALLVLDEVQTGIGRTGKYFAYQHFPIRPDILTVAKGLGGGFPIGAAIIAEEFTDVLKAGMHGSTFGGNHLACAVGYEVLRSIESHKLLENAEKMGQYLIEKLKNLPVKAITEVRGVGLLIGIVLPKKVQARPLVKEALKHGLVIGRAGENILRLAPPLVVRKTTIDRAVEKIHHLLKDI